jgi:hypothetical protein
MLFFDALEALPWPLPSPFEESTQKDKKKVRTLPTQRENGVSGGKEWMTRGSGRLDFRPDVHVSVWRWVLWTEEEGGQGAAAGGGRGRRTAHRGRLQVRPFKRHWTAEKGRSMGVCIGRVAVLDQMDTAANLSAPLLIPCPCTF